MIVIADPGWDTEHSLRYFNRVVNIFTIENFYTHDKKWYFQQIFLCRELTYNKTELKEIFNDEICYTNV